MTVPFRDLKRGIALRRQEWERGIVSAISSCEFGRPNAHIEAFEEKWANYCGVKHAIATSSGSTALLLCYLAFGLDASSEVVSVGNTFVATLEAAEILGARPRLCDVERHSYALDPSLLADRIDDQTRMIVPFHPFGRMAPMREIKEIGRSRGIPIVEEACQAHGASLDGKKAGTHGDAAVFSFGPTKPLAGLGEGGAVVTNDSALASELRRWNNHGRVGTRHAALGLNFRMHPIEAAFLSLRLPILSELLEERRSIASRYNDAFGQLGITHNPQVPDLEQHSYYLYVVETEDRMSFTSHLQERGIGWDLHYPTPVHRQPPQQIFLRDLDLPVTDTIQSRMCSIPMINGMSAREVELVIEVVLEAQDAVASRVNEGSMSLVHYDRQTN